MTPIAWRRHRALLLRQRGWTYRQIADNFGVSTARARDIVFRAAWELIGRRRRQARGKVLLELALYVIRMRDFNRYLARRAYDQSHG